MAPKSLFALVSIALAPLMAQIPMGMRVPRPSVSPNPNETRASIRIVPPVLGPASVGVPYTLTFYVFRGYPPSSFRVSAGALPAGLSLSPDGTLSGIPVSTEAASFTVSGVDSMGRSAESSYSLAATAPLVVSSNVLASGTVDVAYGAVLDAKGGRSPYKWTISAGQLPPGLNLGASGALSGTPYAAGQYPFVVQVSDQDGRTAEKVLSISIASEPPAGPALSISTPELPEGIIGTAYSATLDAAGGTPPYTWSVASGQLPAGLALGAAGTVSGIPSVAGAASVAVGVADAAGSQVVRTLNISIFAGLTILTTGLPGATVGSPYSVSLMAGGGAEPYTWSLDSGQLPEGLALSPAGAVAGTPSAPATSEFQVKVSDSKSRQAAKSLALKVDASLSIVTSALPAGTVGVPYSATISATGGTAPYTWSLASGELPGGVGIGAGGIVSGTPTAPGSWSISLLAADSASGQATRAFSITVASSRTGSLSGGLTSYPTGVMGPNLVSNAGFEQASTTAGKAAAWVGNDFVLDGTVSHGGAASLRITDPQLIPYSQSARQDIQLRPGIYHLSGWVKMNGLAATRGSGVRLCLLSNNGSGCTEPVKGTSDWQQLTLPSVVIAQQTTATVKLDCYAEPDGTAWFDDMDLHEEELPIKAFMLYPNYRGIMFDDRPQTSTFEVTVMPPNGTALADYSIKASVTDESSGKPVLNTSKPASERTTMQFDMSALPGDRAYLARFALVRTADGVAVSEYPAYSIIKRPAAARNQMAVYVDEHNRIVLAGRPRFLLGVYDAGLGYTTTGPAWESLLSEQRRLFELPVNVYLNYWYGGAGNASILPLLDLLHTKGIYGLTNANCFANATYEEMGGGWFLNSPDEVPARATHPNFLGLYVADECTPKIAPNAFGHSQRARSLDSDGIVFGALLTDSSIPLWRDTLDVLATDPYPLWGAEPASGYPLGKVAEGTRAVQEAVHNSRPVVTVLQYFQSTSNSRWPTAAELRNMSYMAIAEGTNGLLYWSLGVRALAHVCSGWCDQKVEYFNRLKTVMSELNGLQDALSSLDHPELLSANSASSIRTRVKYIDGKACLIASNTANTDVTARFTWAHSISSLTAYGETRTVSALDSTFSDTFRPYEAHVYIIE